MGKRKIVKSLKTFTRAGNKDCSSDKFIFDTTNEVRQDYETGKQKVFQRVYLKMLKAEEEFKTQKHLENKKYEMDCNKLWAAAVTDEEDAGEEDGE